jgi:hypothetical protein
MMSIRCIGKKGCCPAKVFQNFKIGAFRNLIKPTDFDKAAFATMGPGIRKRALTPEVVTWLIVLVSLHKTSMAGALLHAWETLRVTMSNLPKKIVSAQAWWKARKRVPVGFFRNIFEVETGFANFKSLLMPDASGPGLRGQSPSGWSVPISVVFALFTF